MEEGNQKMEKAAILHRPDSEYAYLYEENNFHIRLRTKKGDIQAVNVIKGDPYLITEDKWYLDAESMKRLTTTEQFDYWLLETNAEFKRLQYGFHLIGKDGAEVFYGDRGLFDFNEKITAKAENYFRMPYFQEIARFKAPKWVKETIWYQIFPERFANGDTSNDPKGTLAWSSKEHPGREDFFGGDLQGVIDHLDYLVDLGINGIYLCPIFKAHSNHKYDTIDYYEIDPDFGDKETFRKLVAEAHKRGIKIMLDAVFNHMGYESPQWQDVVKNQEESPYASWFHIHSYPVAFGKNGNEEGAKTVSYDTFAFTPRMPKLNTANSEVQAYLLEIATYWIKEFDIDAWRLDVANEVDHHFWKRFYQETVAIKADFYILGEIWHSSQSWLNGDEFHAVMNYAYTETIEKFFVEQSISGTKMISGLNEQLMLYRQQTNEVMFNMLDSHDTARLLTIAEEDKAVAQMTLAFAFLQPGSPCIYYGTEVGMTGENDPDCRKPMIWEKERQDQEFLVFTKELIQLRKEYQEVLSLGILEFIQAEDETEFIGFKRENDKQVLTAYFNRGKQCQVYSKNQGQVLAMSRLADEETVHEKGFVVLIEKK